MGAGAREPLRSICFGNRCDAPDEGRQAEAICVSGEVSHDGFGDDRDSAILRVELCEIAQVDSATVFGKVVADVIGGRCPVDR